MFGIALVEGTAAVVTWSDRAVLASALKAEAKGVLRPEDWLVAATLLNAKICWVGGKIIDGV